VTDRRRSQGGVEYLCYLAKQRVYCVLRQQPTKQHIPAGVYLVLHGMPVEITRLKVTERLHSLFVHQGVTDILSR
jgi:hypothetical protein